MPTETRAVTERDLRLPEFRDVDPAELEFRADGKIVRKDRWERGIHAIIDAVGLDHRSFEIDDVVAAVASLAEENARWQPYPAPDAQDNPHLGSTWDVRLQDGSVLSGAKYVAQDCTGACWQWFGQRLPTREIVAVREPRPL